MIIGICGLIGSGKDTVAQTLIDNHNFVKTSFADRLKDAVAVMFSWDRELLDGKTDESRAWREQKDEFWSAETGREITPRLVLQEFGTECMRVGFFDGIWVSLTKQHLLQNKDKNFVITDVRFPNEAKMILEAGGQVWRVKRGIDPMWFRVYQDIGVEPKDVHESEWRWANVKFDSIIGNNGTMEDLKNQVQDHLASISRLASA